MPRSSVLVAIIWSESMSRQPSQKSRIADAYPSHPLSVFPSFSWKIHVQVSCFCPIQKRAPKYPYKYHQIFFPSPSPSFIHSATLFLSRTRYLILGFAESSWTRYLLLLIFEDESDEVVCCWICWVYVVCTLAARLWTRPGSFSCTTRPNQRWCVYLHLI